MENEHIHMYIQLLLLIFVTIGFFITNIYKGWSGFLCRKTRLLFIEYIYTAQVVGTGFRP